MPASDGFMFVSSLAGCMMQAGPDDVYSALTYCLCDFPQIRFSVDAAMHPMPYRHTCCR